MAPEADCSPYRVVDATASTRKHGIDPVLASDNALLNGALLVNLVLWVFLIGLFVTSCQHMP